MAFATPLLANAGTPLMITGTLYLLFGNAVIGVAEGALLAAIFRLPYGKSIGLLVLANYFSAWVGGVFLRSAIVSRASLDVYNAWPFFWTMVAAAYGITLAMELPFVLLALRRTPGWVFKSLWGSLVVQTASYCLIFGWYWTLSGTSLYTEAKVVEPSAMSLPEDVVLFYISARDGDVYARPLAGNDEEPVYPLHSSGLDDRLFFRRLPGETDRQELVARVVDKQREATFVPLGRTFPVDVVPALDGGAADASQAVGNWFSFGTASRLGVGDDSDWRFSSGFWALEGLEVERGDVPNSRVRVCYETPFGHWEVRNVIHLPADKALFQLGPDQICVYDPETRQLALLVKGRGLTAVVEPL